MDEREVSKKSMNPVEQMLKQNPNYDAFCAGLNSIDTDASHVTFLKCTHNGINYLIFQEMSGNISVFLESLDLDKHPDLKAISSFAREIYKFLNAKVKK